jgi:hypothetical protein
MVSAHHLIHDQWRPLACLSQNLFTKKSSDHRLGRSLDTYHSNAGWIQTSSTCQVLFSVTESSSLGKKKSPFHPQGLNWAVKSQRLYWARPHLSCWWLLRGISCSVNNYVNKITQSGCQQLLDLWKITMESSVDWLSKGCCRKEETSCGFTSVNSKCNSNEANN